MLITIYSSSILEHKGENAFGTLGPLSRSLLHHQVETVIYFDLMYLKIKQCCLLVVLPMTSRVFGLQNLLKRLGYCLAADVPETFQEVVNFVAHSGKVEALAVSPNGNLMAR